MTDYFTGSVKSGAFSVDFIPYPKASVARILISMPMKLSGETLAVIKSRQMGMNYGDADLCCVAFSVFASIMDVLTKDALVSSRLSVVRADCYASKDSFNVIVDLNGQVGKALGILKNIARGIKPSYAVYSNAMRQLHAMVDKKHVPVPPSRDGFDAAVNQFATAAKNISVLYCGKVIVKKSTSKTANQRVTEKVKAANEALKDIPKSTGVSLPKHPSIDTSYKFSRTIKGAMDFFAVDLLGGFCRGNTIVFDRNPDVTADKKKSYAHKLVAGLKDNLEAACAFNAAAVSGFSADEIARAFGKNITEKQIVDAI